LSALAGAIRAFLDDLHAAGLAERVAVLTFSEFGRRVAENGSYGTDHGTAAPVFLAGKHIKAGLIGQTPSLIDLQDGDLKMGIDRSRTSGCRRPPMRYPKKQLRKAKATSRLSKATMAGSILAPMPTASTPGSSNSIPPQPLPLPPGECPRAPGE